MFYIKTSTAMGTDAAQGFREPGQMLMPNSSLDLNLLGSLGFMNFLWKRKLLSFIMWTSQEDVWGSSWFSRSNCSSTARAFGGVFDAERLALTEALWVCVCVLFTRFSGLSGQNEFTQRSTEQTIKKKKRTQRQFTGRHPQIMEVCACLSVIQPVVQRICWR